MRPMFLRLSFAIIAASCLCPPCLHAGGPISWHQLNFRDTQGKPILAEPAKWTVLCFLGTECPLARLYGPRLQSLADRYADRGVSFLGVNSNVQDSPAEIDAYARRHSIKFKIAKDSDQSIADAVGATRTPEVVVIDSGGLIRYQGRIDDQYEPGIARAKPTRNDLRDAIESLLAGNPTENPRPPASVV